MKRLGLLYLAAQNLRRKPFRSFVTIAIVGLAAGTLFSATLLIGSVQRSLEVGMERLGADRWLVTDLSPDQVWPLLREFWQESGFIVQTESPETGIISAHGLMDSYVRKAKAKGAEIVCSTEVTGIEQTAGGYRVSTRDAEGGPFSFCSERVINAAGLRSDVIAAMVGCPYTLHYCKGDYFSLSGIRPGAVRGLVYPVPEKDHAGLGVHLTVDLGGRMKLGPDTSYIGRHEDYTVDPAKRRAFFEKAARFLPFLREEDLAPDMSGIRPKLQEIGRASCRERV